MCFFSATLHSPEIAKLADTICDRPTWVDLKGRDTVPKTVHHVVVRVDPDREEESDGVYLAGSSCLLKARARVQVKTDGATVGPGSEGREEGRAERLKRMKPQVGVLLRKVVVVVLGDMGLFVWKEIVVVVDLGGGVLAT